jgi:hypothetical protein
VPALLVAFHVFGALLVWIAVLRLSLSLRTAAAAERSEATTPAAAPLTAGAPHPAATT